eukprot:m.17227 g.17227  ORF g.17227 m.17227 type:complete len:483 (+) comp9261_c0_seq1:1912-3360(+)
MFGLSAACDGDGDIRVAIILPGGGVKCQLREGGSLCRPRVGCWSVCMCGQHAAGLATMSRVPPQGSQDSQRDRESVGLTHRPVLSWRAVLQSRQRTVSHGHDADGDLAADADAAAASVTAASTPVPLSPFAFRGPRSERSGSGSARASSPLRVPGAVEVPSRFTTARHSPLAFGQAQTPHHTPMHDRVTSRARFTIDQVETVETEAASHADIAADLLGTASSGASGHTWHGHVAAERWRSHQSAHEQEQYGLLDHGQHAEDEYHSEQSPSRPPRSRTFAWLPSRPSSTETPEEDPEAEREIASSVSVADDLLGTSRGSRWQGASQQRQQGYRASSDHFSTHTPGSLPRVTGSQTTWSGGYATTATAPRASPPIRTPQALSSLFDQPHDDDSEDDMSADEDDGEDLSEEESGDFAPAEQRWIDTLAARHRAQFGAAANHGQHTWHGADSRLAEGWSEVLRARQVGRTAEDSHTTPRAPPACGR